MTDGEPICQATDPHALAKFWEDAVGYNLQHHAAFVQHLLATLRWLAHRC